MVTASSSFHVHVNGEESMGRRQSRKDLLQCSKVADHITINWPKSFVFCISFLLARATRIRTGTTASSFPHLSTGNGEEAEDW